MPWEALSDLYREVVGVGGIPTISAQTFWMKLTGNGMGKVEDHAVAMLEHPYHDAWWQSKMVDWNKIDVPAMSVTGWSSVNLHLRGTIAAWKKFASRQKYLWIHVSILNSFYYRVQICWTTC
jgi:uncharacterized protein